MKWWTKLALAVGTVPLFAGAWLAWEARQLPNTEEIRTRLFAANAPKGQATWVPLWAISPKLQTAVLMWEDPSFYHHDGFDFTEIGRAAAENLRAGRYRRGASTITQQVARNLFLGPEKTLRRKVREAILARRLERALSKEEILVVYLNVAEWGDGIAGAEAASRRYFSKPAADLNWAEAALLAGILPIPRQRNPCKSVGQAVRARHAVLTKLLGSQSITPEEFQEADAAACCGCYNLAPLLDKTGKP